jgi:hypothetical protein
MEMLAITSGDVATSAPVARGRATGPQAGGRTSGGAPRRGEPFRKLPSSLSPRELLSLATWSGAQVRSSLQQSGEPLVNREYELLERTSDYELWLIHWPKDDGLVLHDHGGSSGAFQVVSGVLEETSTSLARGRPRLRRRNLSRGQSTSFGSDYLHSVVNPQVGAATSVHAYSPPLTSLRFYEDSRTGLTLSKVETEWDGAP